LDYSGFHWSPLEWVGQCKVLILLFSLTVRIFSASLSHKSGDRFCGFVSKIRLCLIMGSKFTCPRN
jgi:hypothetical protein